MVTNEDLRARAKSLGYAGGLSKKTKAELETIVQQLSGSKGPPKLSGTGTGPAADRSKMEKMEARMKALEAQLKALSISKTKVVPGTGLNSDTWLLCKRANGKLQCERMTAKGARCKNCVSEGNRKYCSRHAC